ncbi:MAG: DNA polymerase I [Actinobacteria bacterium]|nr:DNA polymerase I [Actinomycetota bacterium]
MSSKIILLDGNNIAYRAFYALPATIATSSGTITNAVLGFTSMLLKLIEEQRPDVIACAFDSRGPTFRHDIFNDYKATRKKMPDELIGQMSLIKEVLKAFDIKILEVEGYEADDIIATLASAAPNKFNETLIVSSDKDILQLVSKEVKVMSIKKGITDTVIFNEEKVQEKFGIIPEKIKDFLALTGDSSDNIPGVAGIGPKTALSLLEKYGSIEEIYENVEKIKNEKLKALLIASKEVALKSKELTKLKTEMEINVDEVFNSIFKNIDYKKIEHIFDTLEFSSLKKRAENIIKKIGKSSDESLGSDDSKQKNIEITGKKTRQNFFLNELDFKKIKKDEIKKVFITVLNKKINENESSNPVLLNGVIISDESGNSWFIDESNLHSSQTGKSLKSIMENEMIEKSGFDLKLIYKYLKSFEITTNGVLIDYKIIYLLLNPVKSDISLNEIAKDLLGVEIDDFLAQDINISSNIAEPADKNLENNQMSFSFAAEEKEKPITLYDPATVIKELGPMLKLVSLYKKIDIILIDKIKEENIEKLYYEIEAPLVKVFAEIELKGVYIDKKYLDDLIKEYEVDINRLTDEIYNLCDEKFNINSTQQLAQVLFEKLKLQTSKKTKTGFSTGAGTLLAIYNAHPVIEKILDYREKVKLKNTYLDVLPNLIDPRDNRVHTTYNQLGTTTGRISSNNPNLQNIPVRTELGKQIRKAFIPGEGYDLLLSADYSQIELRILAHLADDEDLISAFNSGQDIHSRTASEIFGIKYSEVDENLRRKAKAINFGIIYGMTEFGLKSRLSISEDEAREYIRLYFSRYPKVRSYMDFLIETAYKTGYTTTIFGRKRYIKELATTNANIRNLGERLAVNTPIQGSAADIMKLSTVMLFNSLKKENIDSNIILHVHDEIILELKERDLDKIKAIVIDSMENCIEIKAKLKVDIKTGRNWYI